VNTRIAAWLVAAVALAAPAPADARPSRAAAPLADPAQRAAVDWQPLALAPVTLADGTAWSAVPASAATAGEVTVDARRGALVRLGPLQTMRIRAEPVKAGEGRRAPLKFVRLSDATPATSRVAVEEAGLEVSPGTWLIEQPPGSSGDWVIAAAEPTRIVALGPTPRRGELIWEHVAGALIEWTARGGELPPLPEVADAPIVRRELLADAAIAAAIAESDPNDRDLQEAVRHWRTAAALQRVSVLRPPDRPTFAMENGPRALQNTRAMKDESGREWLSTDRGRTWELTMTGPGVAWIAARHAGHKGDADLVVTVAGRRLGRIELQQAAEGRLYGPTRRVAVPLVRGEHTYRLRVSDDALLDVKVGQLNERLATSLRGEGIDDFVRKARRALTRTTSKRAYLVEALLATVDGRPIVGELDAGDSAALALTVAWLKGQEHDLPTARRRALARELARHADAVADPSLSDRARAAALDMLEGSGDQALARQLAGPRAADLPAPTLERLARLIEGPALPVGSPALALFESARRRAPYDLALRDAYREHWAESTRWSTLHEDDGSAPSLQWIEPLPDDAARTPQSSSLWSLQLGKDHPLRAAALAEAPARPALLRLYAHLADESGPVGVAVDGKRWQTLPLAQLERLSVAVPPGEHALAVSAPKGARVWSSLPTGADRTPDARLLRMWQVTPDAPARFLLPGQPSFARVEVRALAGDAPRRVRLLLRTDRGPARSVEVELQPHSELVAVDGAPKAGAVATAVIPIDPRSKSLEVAVAKGGPSIAVTAAVRSPGVRDAETEQGTGPKGHAVPDSYERSLQIVEETSRELLERPDDAALLLTRADALLAVGQRAYAVADFNRVLARPLNASLHPRAVAFAARLEALGSPRHIDVKTDAPVLVGPALATVDLDAADLDRLAPVADKARAAGPLAGLQALATVPAAEGRRGDRPAADLLAVPESMSKTAGPEGQGTKDMPGPLADPAAEALRASLLDAAGRPAEAASAWARVYAATGSWQTGLAGVESSLAALDDPSTTPDGAGLAYGLAVQVRPTVRTGALDRLQGIAGERSRWSRLIMSERRSSQEKRELGPRPEPPTPRASVRAALLAAPWSIEEREVLRPGAPLTIDLSRAPSALSFDVWCRNVRPDLGTGDPTLRFHAGEEKLLEKRFKADVPGEARITLPGAYSVTVELDGSDRGHLCAVRMRDGGARASAPPSRWHVARSARPLEFTVLGPTTVEIEAYSQESPGGRLAVALGRGDNGGFSPARTIALTQLSVSPTMSDAPSIAPAVLTLPEPGPYRIQLTPDDGAAVIRLRQRLDDQGKAAPPKTPALARDPETEVVAGEAEGARAQALALDGDVRPTPQLPAGARKVQRFGTPFAEVHMGTDDLEEADDFRPRISGVVRLGYARELLKNRLWIDIEPELRPREDTAMVGGGRLTLQGYMPRAGLRVRASGLGLAQFESDLTPWSARGELRLDRPTWVAPRVQLLPGIEASYRHQSLDEPTPLPTVELHPRVYQRYLEQHPFALRPSFDVRLVPWQDARIVVGADFVPNSDFRGIDQVNMHAGINGAPVLYSKVVPEFLLDYEASIRFKDEDRAQTYLRSRILAGLGVAFWAGDVARIALGVRNALYLSAPFPARNGLDLWLRIDLPLGRGLRDYGPFAMPFRAAREHRLWR
jgi:hypothetical protein